MNKPRYRIMYTNEPYRAKTPLNMAPKTNERNEPSFPTVSHAVGNGDSRARLRSV